MDREKLKDIIPALARKYKFRPAIVEKDYYLTLILNNIETGLSDKLVLKGGTLLNKIYFSYRRLSEDLDFVYSGGRILTSRSARSKAITPIREMMPRFLELLDLRSKNPMGEGFNNSTQYFFDISYPSFVTGKAESIRIEVALRQSPLERPVRNIIKHFYRDPFTDKDLMPKNKILSLSLNEAVAEKLKAAISRRDVAIRDYYDLWHIAESGFDFHNRRFLTILKKKLDAEGYSGDYRYHFGLSVEKVVLLQRQVETDLNPVIRLKETFNIKKVFAKFDRILNE